MSSCPLLNPIKLSSILYYTIQTLFTILSFISMNRKGRWPLQAIIEALWDICTSCWGHSDIYIGHAHNQYITIFGVDDIFIISNVHALLVHIYSFRLLMVVKRKQFQNGTNKKRGK